MKKIFSILAIIALVISVSSCANKKKKAEVGTHTHEDGTVHADDAHAHPVPAQEAFEVTTDNDTEHKHEGGDKDEHGHEHGDEAGHDHDLEHGEHK